jgi:hypothetical protein
VHVDRVRAQDLEETARLAKLFEHVAPVLGVGVALDVDVEVVIPPASA